MYRIILISMIIMLGNIETQAFPVVSVQKSVESIENGTEEKELSRKALKKVQREKRKQIRMERKVAKIQRFLEKKGIQAYGVMNNFKFRLGIIALAGSIVLGIVRLFISLGGIIGLLTTLLALGGVVLVVWGLLEVYG